MLPGFLWALGGRLDALFQWPRLGRPWRWVGSVFLMAGALGTAWSMVVLSVRGRGLPISHLAPRRFVREGPYRFVRHPIYLACVLGFAGAGLVNGSIGRAVCASSFLFAGSVIYSLGFEEPRLEQRLGKTYRAYRVSVPLFPFPGLGRTLRRAALSAWTAAIPVIDGAANRVVLFRLGPTVWATYGALLALGAAAAAALIGGLMLAGGLSRATTFFYLASLTLAAVAVGRLVWLAYQGKELIRSPLRVLRTIGFVSWGTIAAAMALPFIFARFVPHSALWLLDRTLPGLLVAAAIGRLGCLTYGCCFGRPSVHGIRWTNPDAKLIRQRPESAGERRVPTQLIASAWALFALALVLAATSAPIVDGVVAGLTLVLYAIGRFGGDCLRDEPRFGAWGLTAGQIGSAAAGSIGLGLIFAASGPPAWEVPAWRIDLVSLLALWPAIAVSFAIVFLGCGLHWRRVGRW
jgi:prolipoprotein diacylglyceryltransferase/protein-S-isoprenylcysteine O-methyltransferase Ste14